MSFFKKKEPAKPQFEQNNVNTALQAAITPIGLISISVIITAIPVSFAIMLLLLGDGL